MKTMLPWKKTRTTEMYQHSHVTRLILLHR
jgi:hypothetical protein